MILKNTYKELNKNSDKFIGYLKGDAHIRTGALRSSLKEKQAKDGNTFSFLEYGMQNRVWDSNKNPLIQLKTKDYAKIIGPGFKEDLLVLIRKIFKK